MNCLHLFKPKHRLEFHKKVCEYKDFCDFLMLSEGAEILEFNQYQKSISIAFVFYADLECMMKKIDAYKKQS